MGQQRRKFAAMLWRMYWKQLLLNNSDAMKTRKLWKQFLIKGDK